MPAADQGRQLASSYSSASSVARCDTAGWLVDLSVRTATALGLWAPRPAARSARSLAPLPEAAWASFAARNQVQRWVVQSYLALGPGLPRPAVPLHSRHSSAPALLQALWRVVLYDLLVPAAALHTVGAQVAFWPLVWLHRLASARRPP